MRGISNHYLIWSLFYIHTIHIWMNVCMYVHTYIHFLHTHTLHMPYIFFLICNPVLNLGLISQLKPFTTEPDLNGLTCYTYTHHNARAPPLMDSGFAWNLLVSEVPHRFQWRAVHDKAKKLVLSKTSWLSKKIANKPTPDCKRMWLTIVPTIIMTKKENKNMNSVKSYLEEKAVRKDEMQYFQDLEICAVFHCLSCFSPTNFVLAARHCLSIF